MERIVFANRILDADQWRKLRNVLFTVSDSRFIFNFSSDLDDYIGIYVPPRGEKIYRIFLEE